MAGKGAAGDVVIIKKYANRRLYNTRSSSYITLDHLAKMTREEVEFQVVDAKSGADITHQILTQIIMEEEASSGEQILPVNFLRQLIAMYGNSMQSLLPHYLEASMDHFRDNQLKLRKAFEESLGNNPLAAIAQRNMEMFKAAAAAFLPGVEQGHAGEKPAEKPASADKDDALDALKAQMVAMQKKLDELGK
jgi:polyhydroxyalkanoate synthesis repressor PhaR